MFLPGLNYSVIARSTCDEAIPFVMRGLDPRIHHPSEKVFRRGLDCRVKPGNDEKWIASLRSQ
jgi:hypothetical protein